MVVERFVRRIASFVIRWRCSSCGARFTQCPSFALPRKRYVREQILERCARYADEDGATYRSTVRHEGLPVAYEAAVADSIDERTLAPSTPWRWMARLGSLRETCRRAFEMIRARSPRSTLFRHPFVAAAGKYRSDGRRAVVESALRLVHAEAAYRTLFGASIFPGLATAAGWM